MQSEIIINKHDYNRVVLTEVQPYELPFIITNEGFYSYLKSRNDYPLLKELFLNVKTTLPFDFKITKTNNSYRKLSLIHPLGQARFVDFYRNYHSLIKSKCGISKFSLRYPVDTALFYVEAGDLIRDSKLKDEGVDIDSSFNGETPVYASSFFTYRKYNFLYKFYDSYEFHRIERKFDKLHKFDISKCFENLSPDMVPTASKNETLMRSHKHSLNSFESNFADLMGYVNFGRNHGIVIGPEFSRIFAELLMQRLDSEIEVSLRERQVLFGRDYIIRRYVDDYFLFYRENKILDIIKRQVLETLSNYKLFTNESKDEYFDRPFITGVTNAKLDISEFFSDLFEHVDISQDYTKLDITYSFSKYFKLANKYVTKLKSIVKSHEVEYESISGYFLTILRTKVCEINEVIQTGTVESTQKQPLNRFLLMIIDILFFMYSMDGRVRATYLVSEIIIQIVEISRELAYESEMMLADKILQEAKFSIKNADKNTDSVESLNLALSLEMLNTENSLSVNDVRNLINFKKEDDALNYFQFVVGIYFIKNQPEFYRLKIELCESAIKKIISNEAPLEDSEIVHILFDLLSCPFLSVRYRKNVINQLHENNIFPPNLNADSLFDEISSQYWFVDWSKISIKRLLKKKQLRSPY